MGGTPYERTVNLGALSANDIVQVAFPTRIDLTRVNCIGPAAYNLNLYSRAFVWAAVKVLAYIEDNGSTMCRLVFATQRHGLQIGDTITVAGTTVAGYHVDHVVTAVVGQYRVDTDQAFTTPATGGSATLNIPVAQQPLYEVIPIQAAVANVVRWAGEVPFCNQDALTHLGRPRFIYVKVSQDGNYRITLTGTSSVGACL